jgi:hypothetical protein
MMQKTIFFRFTLLTITMFIAFPWSLFPVFAQSPDEVKALENSPVVFINPYIENGSRFNWKIGGDGVIYIQQVYDYERSALNRTAEHWHFLLEAKAGSDLTIVLQSFGEIYNGHIETMPAYMSCVVSEDGKKWRHIPTEWIETPLGPQLKMEVHMASDSLFLARVEPYRVSNLDNLFSRIKSNNRIQISLIGKSVQGRELHIIRVGNENAPHKIFIRGRVHPWEPGGNWVIEGLIETLLQDTEEADAYLENYCLYILPMANIDGVANGVTRFNMKGMDLNRNLTNPADPVLAPENLAMETWLEDMIRKGMKPDLAIDFHNDSNGPLIFAPPREDPETYMDHMKILETLLRDLTWFSEYTVISDAETSTMFARGLMDRYDIESLVYELHSNWIEGLKKRPLSDDWLLMGKQLCEVFDKYFNQINKK